MPSLHFTPVPHGILVEEKRPEKAATVAFVEGPAADASGQVFFTDIMNNRIMRFDTTSGKTSVWRADSGRANGLLFDAQGRLLACEGNEFGEGGRRRITRTDMSTGKVEVLTDRFEGVQYNSPNDIAARSNGQIFFTDPCYGDRCSMQMPHESVYRIDPDGRVSRILSQPDIQRPNGIALSPEQNTLYVVDSCPVVGGNRKIWAFELSDAGTVSGQRAIFDFAPGRGGDGMAVDRAGKLYVAAGIYHARGVHEEETVPTGIYVITADGQMCGRIPIYEDVITNCTFGGDDLRTLYVTAGKTLYSIAVKYPGWLVHREKPADWHGI